MRPEYINGWWVPTTCVHPIKHSWTPRKAEQAEQELRVEFGNIGLMMSAYKYPVPLNDKHTEGWGHPYFDFDGEGPGQAQRDARKLVAYLTDTLGLGEEDIQVYFSGNKGYHVFFNASAFGIKPMPYIHKFYGYLATTLRDKLDLTSLDTSIYNRSRMIRLSNSIHEKSGRYRILIPVRTLMERSHVEIKNRASQPGPTPSEFRYIENPDHHLVTYAQAALDAFNKIEKARPVRLNNIIPDDVAGLVSGLPTCVQDLLDRFMTSKYRFPAQSRIISYFKLTGVPEEETLEMLADRIRENYAPHEQADRIIKVKSAIEQIYRGDYTFSCAFALSVTKYETGDNKVKCSGSACPLYNHCGSGNTPQLNIII